MTSAQTRAAGTPANRRGLVVALPFVSIRRAGTLADDYFCEGSTK
jgi:hypothetical protein